MVDEEIPHDNVERFECLEKRDINVMNYYYYFEVCLFFPNVLFLVFIYLDSVLMD